MKQQHRILVSNLGYARDIDGSALRHVARAYRNIVVPPALQRRVLNQLKDIITRTDPDICCLIEVDTGSPGSCGLNQFDYVASAGYPFRDVVSKYISRSLQTGFFTRGKCNGFMAKQELLFQRFYLSHGSKRLIYRLQLNEKQVLFFTHLSLKKDVRQLQLQELRVMADNEQAEVIIAGDFNVFAGLSELDVLLGDGKYLLANDRARHTFRLFGRQYLLDLCIISRTLANKVRVEVIDQPFSDHDALLIHVEGT